VPHLAYVLHAFANERLAIQKADRSVQLVWSGPEVPGAQSSALSALIYRTFTSRDPRCWSEVQESRLAGNATVLTRYIFPIDRDVVEILLATRGSRKRRFPKQVVS